MANIRDTIKPQFSLQERQPSFGRSERSPFDQVANSLYTKSPEYVGYNNETKDIYAKLIPSDMFEKIAYNSVKHPKNLYNLTNSALTGEGSDYSLGIDSNTKLGTIAIALLGYTAAANPSQALPELAGPVWWLSGMFASNKIINTMVKAKFGVDLDMEYMDSYGRRKKLFEDPGFICWDLIPTEEIDRIGDALGVPRNIEERREAIHDKIQQIVVQAKTWLMVSAGITTPTVASLMADSLDKPVALTKNMMHSAMISSLEHDVEKAMKAGKTAEAQKIMQSAYTKTFGETGYIVREWGVFTQQLMEKTGLKKQIISEMAKVLHTTEALVEKEIIPAITNKTPALELKAFRNLSDATLANAYETAVTRAIENLGSKPAEFVHQMELHAIKMNEIQNTFNTVCKKYDTKDFNLLSKEQLVRLNKEANGFNGVLSSLKAVFTTNPADPKFQRILNLGAASEKAAFNFEAEFKKPIQELLQGKAHPKMLDSLTNIELKNLENAIGKIKDNLFSLEQLQNVCADSEAQIKLSKLKDKNLYKEAIYTFQLLESIDKHTLIKILQDKLVGSKSAPIFKDLNNLDSDSEAVAKAYNKTLTEEIKQAYKKAFVEGVLPKKLEAIKKANLTATDLDFVLSNIESENELRKSKSLHLYLRNVVDDYKMEKSKIYPKLAEIFPGFKYQEFIHNNPKILAELEPKHFTDIHLLQNRPEYIETLQSIASASKPGATSHSEFKNIIAAVKAVSRKEGHQLVQNDFGATISSFNRILQDLQASSKPLNASNIKDALASSPELSTLKDIDPMKIISTLESLKNKFSFNAFFSANEFNISEANLNVVKEYIKTLNIDQVLDLTDLVDKTDKNFNASLYTAEEFSKVLFNTEKEKFMHSVADWAKLSKGEQTAKLQEFGKNLEQRGAKLADHQIDRVKKILNRYASEIRNQKNLFTHVIEPKILENINTHSTGDAIKLTVKELLIKPVAQVEALNPAQVLEMISQKAGKATNELAVNADDCANILNAIKQKVHGCFNNDALLTNLFKKIHVSPEEETRILNFFLQSSDELNSANLYKAAKGIGSDQKLSFFDDLNFSSIKSLLTGKLKFNNEELLNSVDELFKANKITFNEVRSMNAETLYQKLSEFNPAVAKTVTSEQCEVVLSLVRKSFEKEFFQNFVSIPKQKLYDALKRLIKDNKITKNELISMQPESLLQKLKQLDPNFSEKISLNSCDSVVAIFRNNLEEKIAKIPSAVVDTYNKLLQSAQDKSGFSLFGKETDVQKPLEFIKNKLTDNLLHKRWLHRIGFVGLGLVAATAAYVFLYMGKDNKYNPKIEPDV